MGELGNEEMKVWHVSCDGSDASATGKFRRRDRQVLGEVDTGTGITN